MVTVIKANGVKEPFDDEKLLSSIRRAGVPDGKELHVLSDIKSHLYENIPTSEIYTRIIDSLGSVHPLSRSKYSLKQAVMLLGPTGYPFEDFVSKLLMEDGYQTRVRQIVWGKCVSHEIDVIAEKNNSISLIEAKFHNNPGNRSDIHVAMYTQARFQDARQRNKFDNVWLVTNTKVTLDAISYAQCMNMKIISWSYPEGESLRDLIEKAKLHPITMLMGLSTSQKMTLLKDHIVMCKDLRTHPEYLDQVGLSHEEKKKTLEELDFICK